MNKKITLDLSSDKWQMERMRPGQGVKEGFNLLPAEYQGTHFSWNFAKVPGDVYSDLFYAGEIEDPYFGRNMHRAKWVAEYEWWYSYRFAAPQEMKGKKVRLIFEGIDYSCEVWLNGKYLGKHEGMFSDFDFDITNKIKFDDWTGGANMLMIKLDPPPKNYRNVGGKKVNFSGDYFSGLVPFGIWRPIKIEATENIRVDNIRTDVKVKTKSEVSINAVFEIMNHTKKEKNVTAIISVKGNNIKTKTTTIEKKIKVKPGISSHKAVVEIKNAKLWWPWDMGEQNLYDFTVEIKDGDSLTERIGLREVTMEFNPGYVKGVDVDYPWTFVINGKHHFLRSACWGGQPSFLYGQNSLSKYEDRLKMVKEANINNLRIFGWHPPEIPDFYKICDELGITVWTNFTLATQAYPKEKAFVNGVLHECIATVKQRRNHPSLIFWMGGEEVFFSGAHEESGNKDLMNIIGKTVHKYTNVPYGPASPLSAPSGQNIGFKAHESEHANGHYYGGGAKFMEEYYPALDVAIVPELTAASAPSVKSLKKFIPKDELWPMGLSWAYHWADIDMLKSINLEVFDDFKMNSLEEWVEATQIAQGTVIQFALETYRRRKPHMSGVSLCHFITHVPDIKWGVVDFYGQKKISFDWLKRTYQPLLPSLQFAKRRFDNGEKFKATVWVVNDFQKRIRDLVLEWKIFDGKDIKLEGSKEINVETNSSDQFAKIEFEIPKSAKDSFQVELAIKDISGKVIANNEYKLLVGSQERAKAKALEFRKEAEERKAKYGHSVYRYWDRREYKK